MTVRELIQWDNFDLLTIIITYIIGSLIGSLYENLLFGKTKCGDTLIRKLGLCLPLSNIYGFGIVIIKFLSKIFSDMGMSTELSALIITVVITGMECVSGLMSNKINGYQTWNYTNYWGKTCNNYVALSVSVWWFVLIYVLLSVISK